MFDINLGNLANVMYRMYNIFIKLIRSVLLKLKTQVLHTNSVAVLSKLLIKRKFYVKQVDSLS